jgi:hypothetical protein
VKAEAEHEEEEREKEIKSVIVVNHYGRRTKTHRALYSSKYGIGGSVYAAMFSRRGLVGSHPSQKEAIYIYTFF